MTDRQTDEQLAALEAAEKAADPTPWYLVGKPWMDDDQCDTYAISGSADPHGGKAVLQWCEVDEVSLEADDDEVAAWDEAREKQRANLAFAVAGVNALPSLLAEVRALRECEKEAREVMRKIEAYGPSIVPHLLDSDDNAGQRLRDALAGVRPLR